MSNKPPKGSKARAPAPDTVADAPEDMVNRLRQALSASEAKDASDGDPFASPGSASADQKQIHDIEPRSLADFAAFDDDDEEDDEATALLPLPDLLAGTSSRSSHVSARALDNERIGFHDDDVSEDAATHHQLPVFRALSELVPIDEFPGREPTLSTPIIAKQTVQPSGMGTPAALLDAVRDRVGLDSSIDSSDTGTDGVFEHDGDDDEAAQEISAKNVIALENLLATTTPIVAPPEPPPSAPQKKQADAPPPSPREDSVPSPVGAPSSAKAPPREADIDDDDDDGDSLGLFADEAITPSRIFRLAPDEAAQLNASDTDTPAHSPALVDRDDVSDGPTDDDEHDAQKSEDTPVDNTLRAGADQAPDAAQAIAAAPKQRVNTSFRDAATDVHAIENSDEPAASSLAEEFSLYSDDAGSFGITDGAPEISGDPTDPVSDTPMPQAAPPDLEGWADASLSGDDLDPVTIDPEHPLSELGDEIMGMLIVDVPDGATVFLNGDLIGRGRAELEGLSRFASYAVRVHAPGFRPWSGDVCLDGQSEAVVRPDLVAR